MVNKTDLKLVYKVPGHVQLSYVLIVCTRTFLSNNVDIVIDTFLMFMYMYMYLNSFSNLGRRQGLH